MSDAPKDLRQCAYGIGQSYPVTADVCRQAADYIEKLEAENQRLHAAARATVLEWRKDIWPGDEHKCFMNNRMEELAALVGEKV